jgi:hypothetical protein
MATPYWKEPHSSVLSNDTSTSNSLPTAMSNPAKDIHPEDGNCNVCQNTGDPLALYMPYLKASYIFKSSCENIRKEQESHVQNI